MDVIHDLAACPRPDAGTAVTIGAYDGLHRGHRAVIGEVRRRAAARGLATALVTFDRHPATVVRPESAPLLLTDLDQKLELLETTGVDHVVVLRFDEERAKEPAEHFVHTVLVDCLRARLVIVGEDFHFGHGRGGDVALLQRLGADLGFEAEGLHLIAVEGIEQPVSSTAIRRALAAGDLERANTMLGRPHEVRGRVTEGDHRGQELGFPTANVAVPGDIQLPADGIYAGWFVAGDGVTRPAALSLGRRPTFYETAHASLLEAHVLDFDGDLYGHAARVRFVRRLRGEERFDDVDALVAQIHRDVADTRAALGVGSPG